MSFVIEKSKNQEWCRYRNLSTVVFYLQKVCRPLGCRPQKERGPGLKMHALTEPLLGHAYHVDDNLVDLDCIADDNSRCRRL